ncbi:hypothetical protein QE152_g39103 [Popillia japonica]|uniref:Uncharacterized protein n=1 Tax=Popillia japonica TaxID=7064 RepID=A0AAW1HUY4_POPJA
MRPLNTPSILDKRAATRKPLSSPLAVRPYPKSFESFDIYFLVGLLRDHVMLTRHLLPHISKLCRTQLYWKKIHVKIHSIGESDEEICFVDHHTLYLKLFPASQLTPKFHFLLHLIDLIPQSDPPLHLTCN